MKPPKEITVVEWDDAWQDQENFNTKHGIEVTHAPMDVQTMGMLVVDDEEGISLANERSTQDGSDVYRGRSFIPRQMVKEVNVYRLVKKRSVAHKDPSPEDKPNQPEESQK